MYRELDSDRRDILELLDNISDFADGAGRWAETCAVRTYQFRQMKRLYSREHLNTLNPMSNLAVTLGDQGQLEKAARMIKEVLEKNKAYPWQGTFQTVTAKVNLSELTGR